MPLLQERNYYKPFEYAWAYDAWLTQQRIHWIPEEVSLADDVKDWNNKITPSEKTLLTNIFRFFTQADIEVNNCYMSHYSRVFKPTEIQMMLCAFSNIETVHIAAYSYLMDTIGMPETEYQAFLAYKEMRDKYDYMRSFNTNSLEDIAITMAAFGAFTEGVQLFASFAILLNFQRFGKMKGMGQIISWSIRDETLHCNSIIRLFKEFVREHKDQLDMDRVQQGILEVYHQTLANEKKFIEMCFDHGTIEGMNEQDIYDYVCYIADIRLAMLEIPHPGVSVQKNPIPWITPIISGVEFANFFDNRVTEYSKAATTGSWDNVF